MAEFNEQPIHLLATTCCGPVGAVPAVFFVFPMMDLFLVLLPLLFGLLEGQNVRKRSRDERLPLKWTTNREAERERWRPHCVGFQWYLSLPCHSSAHGSVDANGTSGPFSVLAVPHLREEAGTSRRLRNGPEEEKPGPSPNGQVASADGSSGLRLLFDAKENNEKPQSF